MARVVYCFAYGDAFDGDDEKARRSARFALMFCQGMGDPGIIGLKLSGKLPESVSWEELEPEDLIVDDESSKPEFVKVGEICFGGPLLRGGT